MIVDNSNVLAKHYERLPSGRRFCVPKSNSQNKAINSISEQINLFKRQRSVCVCVRMCVCKLHKSLVYYVTFVFSITVL